MPNANKSKLIVIWISLFSNLFLTLMKVSCGFLMGSAVLLADGVHNAGDIVAGIAALTSTLISNKPADEDHPYGHGKAEVIASAFVSILLGIAALWIAYHSIMALFSTPNLENSFVLFVAIISLLWKQILYLYSIRIGKALTSQSVLATAYDHLADVYASLAAVFGISLALLGKHFGWTWAVYGDPIAGVVVSFFVLKLAWKMGKEAVNVLMEHAIGREKIILYENLLRSEINVKRIDRIRAREHGHYIIVDIRVSVPNSFTIQEGHDISRRLKKLLMDNDVKITEVLVHLNPWVKEE